jgi:hypothetical protein
VQGVGATLAFCYREDRRLCLSLSLSIMLARRRLTAIFARPPDQADRRALSATAQGEPASLGLEYARPTGPTPWSPGMRHERVSLADLIDASATHSLRTLCRRVRGVLRWTPTSVAVCEQSCSRVARLPPGQGLARLTEQSGRAGGG